MSLFKSVSTVSLFTLLSRITGLIRDQLIAATFGASALTDAYNVAFRIPNMFRRFFAEGAFSQAFVPSLGYARVQKGDEAAAQFVSQIATVLLWVLTLTCVVGVIGAPALVWLMAGGLQQNPQGYETAIGLTRWMFPYLGLISLAGLCAAVLNTYQRFAVPAMAPVLLNLSMIAAAWLLGPWLGSQGVEPIYAMAAGVLLGGVLQLGLQGWALARLGRFPDFGLTWTRFRAAYKDESTRSVLRLMLPVLFGVGVSQISLLINTQIASRLATGSVTWLSNADRLMEFPTAMLGVALGVVLTPRLSAARAAMQVEQYSAMLDWGLRLVVVLGLPCACALLLFHVPLAATLFHYGAYLATDALQTAKALQAYGVGLLGLVAIKVLASGFYANKDTSTPVKIAVVVLVVTQLLNLLWVPWLQHAGLALSIGVGALINAGGLLWVLVRRGVFVPQPGWGLFLLQVVVATALMGGVLFWANGQINWLNPEGGKALRALILAGDIVLAAAVFFGALALLRFNLKRLVRP